MLSQGVPTLADTTDPTLGGSDSIDGGTGSDVIFGGFGFDQITGGPVVDGSNPGTLRDVIIGDSGQVNFVAGLPIAITTTDSKFGGDDQITGGTGADIILGG